MKKAVSKRCRSAVHTSPGAVFAGDAIGGACEADARCTPCCRSAACAGDLAAVPWPQTMRAFEGWRCERCEDGGSLGEEK